MTTTPDPKTVREIARKFLLDAHMTHSEFKACIRDHIGADASDETFSAWYDAVRADVRASKVETVVFWPAEQPQDGMARAYPDSHSPWSQWLTDQLLDHEWTSSGLVEASGHVFDLKTVSRWLHSQDVPEPWAAVLVAKAFGASVAEALCAAEHGALVDALLEEAEQPQDERNSLALIGPLSAAELAELTASIEHLSGPDAWDEDRLEPALIPVMNYMRRMLAAMVSQQESGPDDSFAMVAEGAPAGPARNVANHWHSYASAIAPGARSPEWAAIAQVTAAVLAAMDAEQDELERLRGDCKALTEGNRQLQTMNDGLRQMAIEAREAAEGWHRATIDLYSGREEPHPADCPCGRPETCMPKRERPPQCTSYAHPDFVEDQTIRCELADGHDWHRNGERTWKP